MHSLLDDGTPAVARPRSRRYAIGVALAGAALAFGYAPQVPARLLVRPEQIRRPLGGFVSIRRFRRQHALNRPHGIDDLPLVRARKASEHGGDVGAAR